MGLSELKAERLKRKALIFGWFGCFLLCAFSFLPSQAQTFAEWFSQGKTQIKYLTQQIAALNALRVSGEQGYALLNNEWSTIGNLKDGEFGLHQGYYASLSTVSPAVKAYADVPALQAQEEVMLSQFAIALKQPALGAGELVYIGRVREELMAGYGDDLSGLQQVLSSGTLVMSDDERIKRVKVLVADMADRYAFACSFSAEVRLLSVQRVHELNEVENLKSFYGNDN